MVICFESQPAIVLTTRLGSEINACCSFVIFYWKNVVSVLASYQFNEGPTWRCVKIKEIIFEGESTSKTLYVHLLHNYIMDYQINKSKSIMI